MKLVILIACSIFGSNLLFANPLDGKTSFLDVSQENLHGDVYEEGNTRAHAYRSPILAAGIYSSRSGNPRLCDQYIVPVFSGQRFVGYDVTSLGSCTRQTARFTCRRNFCETTAHHSLHISILSATSYVFTNGQMNMSDVFEL